MRIVYITARNPNKVLDVVEHSKWLRSDVISRNRGYEVVLGLSMGTVGWTQDKKWLKKNGYV